MHLLWPAGCSAAWALAASLGFRQARSAPWLLGLFLLLPALFVLGLWALALWLGYPGCSGHPAGRGFFTWIALYGFELMLVLHGIGIVLGPGRRKALAIYAAANVAAYVLSAIPLVRAVAC